MRELLRGYGAAAFETASQNGNLAQVISDLTVFSRTLSTSDALRTTLMDGSVRPEDRRDIVFDLVADKAAPETTALLSFVVRFERSGELASAVATLLLIAEDANAATISEPEGNYGAVRERIRGYAERVLQELGAIGEIDEVEDELFHIARLLDDNPTLRRAMQEVNSDFAGRIGIVAELFSSKVRPATLRIINYVLRAGRLRDFVGTFDRLVELAAAERGRRVAEVRAAVDLDATERERLAQALSQLVERPVEVRVIHDPKVIGGTLIAVGDLVIDGTIRIRFDRLRDALALAS